LLTAKFRRDQSNGHEKSFVLAVRYFATVLYGWPGMLQLFKRIACVGMSDNDHVF